MLTARSGSEPPEGDMGDVPEAPIDMAADPRTSNNLDRPFAALSNNESRSEAVQRTDCTRFTVRFTPHGSAEKFLSGFVDLHVVCLHLFVRKLRNSAGGSSRMSSSWLASHSALHNNVSRTLHGHSQHGNLTVTALGDKETFTFPTW